MATTGQGWFPLSKSGVVRVDVTHFGVKGEQRRVVAGPNAQPKEDEISTCIAANRYYTPGAGEKAAYQVSIEFLRKKKVEFDGQSYTLAVALADMQALELDMVPVIEGRTVIATGVVEVDGQISKIDELAAKIALIVNALQQGQVPRPAVLVMPEANLNELDDEQRGQLNSNDCSLLGIASLSQAVLPRPIVTRKLEIDQAEVQFRRSLSWRNGDQKIWPGLVFFAVLLIVGSAIAYQYLMVRSPDCSGLVLKSLDVACFSPVAIKLVIECRKPLENGYSPWRSCPDVGLQPGEKFRIKSIPGAAGWLYAWDIDDRHGLADIVETPSDRYREPGEVSYIPWEGSSFEIDRTGHARILFFFSRTKIGALELLKDDASAIQVLELLKEKGQVVELRTESRSPFTAIPGELDDVIEIWRAPVPKHK